MGHGGTGRQFGRRQPGTAVNLVRPPRRGLRVNGGSRTRTRDDRRFADTQRRQQPGKSTRQRKPTMSPSRCPVLRGRQRGLRPDVRPAAGTRPTGGGRHWRGQEPGAAQAKVSALCGHSGDHRCIGDRVIYGRGICCHPHQAFPHLGHHRVCPSRIVEPTHQTSALHAANVGGHGQDARGHQVLTGRLLRKVASALGREGAAEGWSCRTGQQAPRQQGASWWRP